MSIILGLMTKRVAIVASDGRSFGPAKFENEKVVDPARISCEEFDKTFEIKTEKKGKAMIGVVAGDIMNFSGKEISEHVREIAAHLIESEGSFAKILGSMKTEMITRISQIPENEIMFSKRHLDLLIASRQNITKGEIRIAALRFDPKENTIVGAMDICSPPNNIRP